VVLKLALDARRVDRHSRQAVDALDDHRIELPRGRIAQKLGEAAIARDRDPEPAAVCAVAAAGEILAAAFDSASRPACTASTSVVPMPHIGSTTSPPGGL
jgi:hypothetical protein